VSAAATLLAEIGAVGAEATLEDGMLCISAPDGALSDVQRQLVIEHRAEIAALLGCPPGFKGGPAGDTVEDWRTWMRMVARRRRDRGQDLRTALSLAWGEAEVVWHLRHGARPDPRRCAGCGKRLEAADRTETMIDGAVIHFDPDDPDPDHCIDCLVLFGQQWRWAAHDGLVALGLNAPGRTGP
jgi:hypothetical protein